MEKTDPKKVNVKPVPRSTKALQDEARRRLHLAELLLEVTRRMASYETLDEVLFALIEMTTAELNAERGTLFLHDPDTNELYSRVAQGNINREIRLLSNRGIAGTVFTSGEPLLIKDAYADDRFNRSIDEQTGFTTTSILCVPIRTVRGKIIGVAETLNKRQGAFTAHDRELLEAMTSQGTLALQSAQFIERMKERRRSEMEFIDVVSDVTADIQIGSLLQRVMSEAARLLNAERSTLFLNDEKTNELWSVVGIESNELRMPNHLGIAGTVFRSGLAINIPYAYADLRFNPGFDKTTGFFTRSILCVPIINKQGKTIGVTQVLNRRGGPFTAEDESRLRAFTAQISIALENAKLFADVQAIKNYNESMLESMSNGVLTFDESARIVTCNLAGQRILKIAGGSVLNRSATEFFGEANAWIIEKLNRVAQTGASEVLMDTEFFLNDESISVNLTVQALQSAEGKRIGTMLLLENISNEKRLKSTMSRYMDPGIADQMLAQGAESLGGKSTMATVLFSDIRSFTTITERLGAQGTVALLNEYFTLMVDCIQSEEGMLDKFIGDAIMAAFGIPVAHDDDADRAVRTAIAMLRELAQWNEQRVLEGKIAIDIGIGLNTDNVVSGNIGSRKRMDYTIIGDGVNLAARLESACKQYGAHILISEFTQKRLRGTYFSRELDLVIVKGQTKPVAIYEILDYHTDASYPNLTDALRIFRSGLQNYRQSRWNQAIADFKDVLGFNAGDKAAQLYIERAEHFRTHPPEAGWDGVWIMESK